MTLIDRLSKLEGPDREVPKFRSDMIRRLEKLEGADAKVLSHLDISSDCWIWKGKSDERGRGRIWHKGKLKLHHRAVWEILIGNIPDGYMLCHHCDNPACANPLHMYIGDGKSNVRDMFSRGHHWTQTDPQRAAETAARTGRRNDWMRGNRNPRSKLSDKQVEAIRNSNERTVVLAQRFDVHISTIQRIRNGSLWPLLRAKEANHDQAI